MNGIRLIGKKKLSRELVLVGLVGLSFLLIGQPLFSITSYAASLQATPSSTSSIHRTGSSVIQFPLPPAKKYKHHDPPMGVADFGRNGSNLYQYYASAFEASTIFHRLYLLGCTGNDPACILNNQLNSIAILYECNFSGTFCRYGYYWIQDLTFINQLTPTKFNIGLWDNIWNFSGGACEGMSGGPVFGNGGISGSGCGSFYEDFASYSFNVTLPFVLDLFTFAYTNSGGNPQVDFFVEGCFGPGFGTCVTGPPFDSVVFNGLGAACSNCVGEDTFVVGGSGSGFYPQDVESTLGGMWNLETIGIPAITVNMGLAYAPQFSPSSCCSLFVPHAYSYGTETGETATGVMMSPPFGCCYALGETGADDMIQLY